MDWKDVISDKKSYPDDMKVSLGEGKEVLLGDLRNGFIPKGDMTKLTTQAAEEKRALEGQVESLRGEISRMVQQLGGNKPTKMEAEDNFADLRDDKIFGPLVRTLEGMSTKLETLEQKSAQHEQVWWVNQHMQALGEIRRTDPDVDVKGLIDYAKGNNIANLGLAHRLMTRDRDIEKARETAAKEAVEKYKTDNPPFIPRGSKAAPKPSKEVPRDFDHAAELASQDPEILKEFSGAP